MSELKRGSKSLRESSRGASHPHGGELGQLHENLEGRLKKR